MWIRETPRRTSRVAAIRVTARAACGGEGAAVGGGEDLDRQRQPVGGIEHHRGAQLAHGQGEAQPRGRGERRQQQGQFDPPQDIGGAGAEAGRALLVGRVEAGQGGRHGLVGEGGDQHGVGEDHDLRGAVEQERGPGEGHEEGEADDHRGDGDGEQEEGVEEAAGAAAQLFGGQGGPGAGGERGEARGQCGQDAGEQGVQRLAVRDVLVVGQGRAGGQGAAPAAREGRGDDHQQRQREDGEEEDEEENVDGPAGGPAMHQHGGAHLLGVARRRRPYGTSRSGRGRRARRTARC